MAKIIILKLASIKYTGDSIGDDIRIELEVLDNFIGINKEIQRGDNIKIDKEVGQFISDKTSLDLEVNIKVIERDLIFNDVGGERVKMKIDLTNLRPQSSTYRITVVESRGISGRSSAVFDITLSAVVIQSVQYVEGIDNGWLRVRLEDDNSMSSLPSYLKVQIYRTDSKREYFTIMEGALQGKKASVKRKTDGSSYLSSGDFHTDPVFAIYSISKKTLQVGNKIYLTEDYQSAKWSEGMYDIEIPDFPHRGGLNYTDVKHAITWFRVGHSGDKYIHTGRNSLGCITVIERDRWDELYAILIKARKGDNVSIGTLRVIE